jgi:EmrB/QacA subfamily drug resistance transporter
MSSSFTLAVADLGAEFGAGARLIGWVVTVYLVATAAALLPCGRLADLRGREKVFFWGLAVFIASLLACALAPGVGFLIGARVASGVGAAMVFGTLPAILTSYSPPGERGRRLGLYNASVYAGLSAGPVLGGIITHYLGWRWIFGFSFLIGLPALVLSAAVLGLRSAQRQEDGLDLPGTVFSVLGISILLYAASGSGLPAVVNRCLFLLGVVLVVAFVMWERRCPGPLLDVRLFVGNAGFSFSNLAAFISYSGSFAVSYILSLYLQLVLGLSPQTAGLVLLGQPILQTLVSPLAGRLSDHWEPRMVASAGMVLVSAALVLMANYLSDFTLLELTGILCLLGLGFGLFASPNVNAIMSTAPRSHYGSASSVLALMRLLGQTLSMGVAGAVLTAYLQDLPLGPVAAPYLSQGVRVSLVIFAALSAVAVPASLARGRIHPHNAE